MLVPGWHLNPRYPRILNKVGQPAQAESMLTVTFPADGVMPVIPAILTQPGQRTLLRLHPYGLSD